MQIAILILTIFNFLFTIYYCDLIQKQTRKINELKEELESKNDWEKTKLRFEKWDITRVLCQTVSERKRLSEMTDEEYFRFLLHSNLPPFTVYSLIKNYYEKKD